jgi:hypothetical protein
MLSFSRGYNSKCLGVIGLIFHGGIALMCNVLCGTCSHVYHKIKTL